MAQASQNFQTIAKVIRELEEDICWLQRHTVNGIVPQKVQQDLRDLQQTRAALLEQTEMAQA